MQYQEAVAEARQLVKRSEEDQWRLAQLTYEQLQGGATQERWAEDVGLSRRHVRHIATIWQQFGMAGAANRPTWTEASEVIRGTQAVPRPSTIRHLPPEQKAEIAREIVKDLPTEQRAAIIREAITDAKTADSVMRDPPTRNRITDSRERIVSEIEGAAHDREQADPTSRAIREASLTLNIESNISKARFWLAEATRQLQDLDERDPAVMERIRRDVAEVELALGWLRTALDGGRVSDEDLVRFIEGGER